MAGDAVTVEVKGVDRLTASLAQLERDLAALAPIRAANIIGTAAKGRAPKRSGYLAGSFSSSAGHGVVTASFGAPHAGPINYGVGPRRGLRGPHNIRATAFLTGAISPTQNAWMKEYHAAAEAATRKVKGI